MFFDSTPSPSDRQRNEAISGQGSFLDRYEILSRIGEGGFGSVYKARHNLMGRTVAIKFLHGAAPDTVTMRRFQVEAQAAASLTHPNIITVYDFGIAPDNQLYLIMDFVEGTSLYEAIGDTEHLEVERAINIFIQACDALDHAHKRGIIHRDLKPSNIMLADDEYEGDFVKIVDFGLAKFMTAEEQNEKLTQTGEVLGTPFYMSPEQCRGEAPDSRSDIYALGCIMYRVLSGQLPISGQNILSTVYQHISKSPLSFAESAPELEIPRELELVVFKALQKDPAERYQTMAELCADLRKVRKALKHEAAALKPKSVAGWLQGHQASALVVGGLLVLLTAVIGLFAVRNMHLGAPGAATVVSQPTNEQYSPEPTAESPARKRAVPVSQVTSPVVPDTGSSASRPRRASTASSSSSASLRGRGKKGSKHSHLARKISNAAEELLTDTASGVGKAGRFIKDLVDDH